jgi:hypothetical protein
MLTKHFQGLFWIAGKLDHAGVMEDKTLLEYYRKNIITVFFVCLK